MKKCLSLILFLIMAFAMTVSAGPNLMVDEAGLFNDVEKNHMEERCEELSDRYDMDVVIVTKNDFYDGDTMIEAADYYDYGGYQKEGVILWINMANREVVIVTSGERVKNTFDQRAIDDALDEISPMLSNGEYGLAALSFLSSVDLVMRGGPFQNPDAFNEALFSGFLVATVVTAAVVIYHVKALRTKGRQRDASSYVKPHSFNLLRQGDIFLYRRVSKTQIETSSNRSGGSFTGSSGISHGGGKRGF